MSLDANAYGEVIISCEDSIIPYAIVGWNTMGADLVVTVVYGRSDGNVYAVLRNVSGINITNRTVTFNYLAK